jgi:hypothetical protein
MTKSVIPAYRQAETSSRGQWNGSLFSNVLRFGQQLVNGSVSMGESVDEGQVPQIGWGGGWSLVRT